MAKPPKVQLRSPINGEPFPPSLEGLASIPDDVYDALIARGFVPIVSEASPRKRKGDS